MAMKVTNNGKGVNT